MSESIITHPDTHYDLGDGLIMRKATLADRETVADFHANTLVAAHETPPLERLRGFVLDLMSEQHPTSSAHDWTVVEDTTTGKIVSSMVLMSQVWTYEGISFNFGQPDIVSTHPDYRRRGLVRSQLDWVHRWSAERGELVQGITGIPWYYRQFGYELALSLDGYLVTYKSQIPQLAEGDSEPYHVRPATLEDVPFIKAIYERTSSRSMLASVREDSMWRYDLDGRSEANGAYRDFRIIETPQGDAVGVLVHSHRLWDNFTGVTLYDLKAGVPFLAVTPAVMRYLGKIGEERAKAKGVEFQGISFNFGEKHPVYDTISSRLVQLHKPYAWYMRVPDIAAFVRHIAPALEKRLAESAQSGYTGDLRISFFRSGIKLIFQGGKISVETWAPEHIEDGDAGFPGHTFLQLLFGYRSLDEVLYAFPDAAAITDDARALLPILFPKKNSNVWSGG